MHQENAPGHTRAQNILLAGMITWRARSSPGKGFEGLGQNEGRADHYHCYEKGQYPEYPHQFVGFLVVGRDFLSVWHLKKAFVTFGNSASEPDFANNCRRGCSEESCCDACFGIRDHQRASDFRLQWRQGTLGQTTNRIDRILREVLSIFLAQS